MKWWLITMLEFMQYFIEDIIIICKPA